MLKKILTSTIVPVILITGCNSANLEKNDVVKEPETITSTAIEGELLLRQKYYTIEELASGENIQNVSYGIQKLNPQTGESTQIQVQEFNGDFVYLLPTNEILYLSNATPHGKGGASFRLYSLSTKEDTQITEEASFQQPIVVEDFNSDTRQVQILTGFYSEIGAQRYVVNLEDKNLTKLGETPPYFFECYPEMEDTEACQQQAGAAVSKFVDFVEEYGLDVEDLQSTFFYPKEEPVQKYTAPSCKDYLDILSEFESRGESQVIGCIVQ